MKKAVTYSLKDNKDRKFEKEILIYEFQKVNSMRTALWKFTLRATLKNPVAGVGELIKCQEEPVSANPPTCFFNHLVAWIEE